MAENAPPPQATTTTTQPTPITNTTSTDSSRGMPYYEKLRRDLRDALTRKRALDTTLSALEESIARTESNYLDDTLTSGGNIIRGFDGYLKSTVSTAAAASHTTGTSSRRKGLENKGPSEADRIFSRSSAVVGRDSPAPLGSGSASGSGTPSGAVTPGGMKRAGRDEDERAVKRGKISYGRD
jgi:chromatin modification-related protein EAF6